ncbi:MAG TPA: ABC transporter ATP-binding protein [Xanthobacteraceae bacterium]|nr:ABC transporter ATP-binding protein [Xanthobacteraceae bacterium]
MPAIDLVDVSVDFPIYTAQTRSIRTDLMRRIGGRIEHNAHKHTTVVQALRHVSLSLRPGDRLGLIGPNGAGKSTLLRVMSGVYEPPGGVVRIEGKVSALVDITLGFDSELSGYDNIILRSVVLGATIAQARERAPDIAEFSELGEFLTLPIRTYSAGMITRLAFAISTAVQPDILLLDEMVSAGDVHFSKKARERTLAMAESASILVLAIHDTTTLRSFCDKAAVLRSGEIADIGPIDEVLTRYEASAAA